MLWYYYVPPFRFWNLCYKPKSSDPSWARALRGLGQGSFVIFSVSKNFIFMQILFYLKIFSIFHFKKKDVKYENKYTWKQSSGTDLEHFQAFYFVTLNEGWMSHWFSPVNFAARRFKPQIKNFESRNSRE